MRILLVTFSNILPYALTQVLNPANEYCAIVVDEPEQSKKVLAHVPQLREKIYPFYELKNCIEKFYFDLLLYINMPGIGGVEQQLRNYGLPSEKFFHLHLTNDKENCFLLERALRYYKEHATEYEIFSTGISYTRDAIDVTQFKKKIFNFGIASQDLYYDYQIAKFILTGTGGGRKYQVCVDWFCAV